MWNGATSGESENWERDNWGGSGNHIEKGLEVLLNSAD